MAHSHHHHNGDEEPGGDIYLAKGTAMAILFLTSMTLGCLPIKLSQWFNWKSNAKNNKYVNLLLGFGGGVLLCTTFLHLLPEVAENFETIDPTPDVEIHYAEFLMCIGFFIMYFVEETVHMYLHHRETRGQISSLRRSLSIRRGEPPIIRAIDEDELPSNQHHNNNHNHHHDHKDHSHVVLDASDNSTIAIVRGLLVVLALSIHELFEGLAVGLEGSARNVWYMFGAVSVHKLVIAFCIGVELVTSKLKKIIIVAYVFTFAVVSPIGIGIGIAVTYSQDSLTVISVVLQGLASGTLLYVVFFEILQHERRSGLKQYLSILIGFLIMFSLAFLE